MPSRSQIDQGFAQMGVSGLELVPSQTERSEIVQAQRFAGTVTQRSMRHQGLHRQAECLVIVTQRFFNQRQVIERVRCGARAVLGRRQPKRLLEVAAGFVEPTQPQCTGREHVQRL